MKIALIAIIGVVVIGMAVGLAIGLGGLFGREPIPTPPCEPGEICLTAQQLCDEYKANAVEADYKYQGKIIKISGEVKGMDRDFITQTAYLKLDCGVLTWVDLVWCYFNWGSESEFVGVETGDVVSVRCACIGKTWCLDILSEAVQLANCTSVKHLY